MKIRASIPSVEEVEVEASRSLTVKDLTNLVCKKLGIEPEYSRLLAEGRPLNPKLKIGQLDLSEAKLIVDYVWARHLILWGKDGQRRLREANILMIGAGAIGNEVAKNLAMLGVGRLTFVDFDVVELSNTSRMIFFDRGNVGKSKAEAIAHAIMKKYPHTKVTAYHSKLEDIPLSAYLEADAIVCGLDNVLSRVYLSTIGTRYLIPIVDGGILGYQARVQTYIPSHSPCLACVLPRGQYGQLAGLKNPCDAPIEDAKIPSLPTTTSLVSAVQTQEVLKLIVGYPIFRQKGTWPQETGEPISGVWIADLRFGKYATMPLNRSEKCMVCGAEGVGRENVKRVEVPIRKLGDSTAALKKAILKLLPKEYGDLQISKIGTEQDSRVIDATKMSRSGIRVGDFLQVTFKSGPERYEDLIVKLV